MATSTQVVVATLNISFSDDSSASSSALKLEIDDREDGLNDGNTSFKPLDSPAYFLFQDANIEVLSHEPTAGGISGAGSGTKEIDDYVTFSNSDSSSLNYPPNGGVTMSWAGRCFEIKKDGTVVPNSALPEVDKSQLAMPGSKKVAGVLHVEYSSTGSLFRLSGVPKDFLEAMIIVVGKTIPET